MTEWRVVSGSRHGVVLRLLGDSRAEDALISANRIRARYRWRSTVILASSIFTAIWTSWISGIIRAKFRIGKVPCLSFRERGLESRSQSHACSRPVKKLVSAQSMLCAAAPVYC